MQPRDTDIRNLALYAPRIALGLMWGVPRVPFVGEIDLQFTSSTVGAPYIVESFENNLTQDTIIERVAFSVYQQNSFAGSPFQSLYFAQLKECTGVGVQFQVYGGPKYNISDIPVPLENVADMLATRWPAGWPLYKQSNVKAQAVLFQTPQSMPYDVSLSFLGWQFLDKCLDDMTDHEARCKLKEMGFEVPTMAMDRSA